MWSGNEIVTITVKPADPGDKPSPEPEPADKPSPEPEPAPDKPTHQLVFTIVNDIKEPAEKRPKDTIKIVEVRPSSKPYIPTFETAFMQPGHNTSTGRFFADNCLRCFKVFIIEFT